jgi:hypothetical protein
VQLPAMIGRLEAALGTFVITSRMTPALLYSLVIQPVVAELNWPQPRERAVLLLAIAIQESDLKHRLQWPSGPAKSWWQIERSTAVDCCTRYKPVANLCAEIGREYENSDLAACAIAAGILRITPGKLPVVGEADESWKYYLKAWRPGKPAPNRWPESYRQSVITAGAVDGDLGAGEVASRRPPREAGPVNKPVNLAKQANPAADIGWASNT